MNQVQDIRHSFPGQGAGVRLLPNFPRASDQILLLSFFTRLKPPPPGSRAAVSSGHLSRGTSLPWGCQGPSGSSWLDWISKPCQRVLDLPFHSHVLPRSFAKVISLLCTRTFFFFLVPHITSYATQGTQFNALLGSPRPEISGTCVGPLAPTQNGVLGNMPRQTAMATRKLKRSSLASDFEWAGLSRPPGG